MFSLEILPPTVHQVQGRFTEDERSHEKRPFVPAEVILDADLETYERIQANSADYLLEPELTTNNEEPPSCPMDS